MIVADFVWLNEWLTGWMAWFDALACKETNEQKQIAVKRNELRTENN